MASLWHSYFYLRLDKRPALYSVPISFIWGEILLTKKIQEFKIQKFKKILLTSDLKRLVKLQLFTYRRFNDRTIAVAIPDCIAIKGFAVCTISPEVPYKFFTPSFWSLSLSAPNLTEAAMPNLAFFKRIKEQTDIRNQWTNLVKGDFIAWSGGGHACADSAIHQYCEC